MEIKNDIIEVPKVWGKEVWLVNNDKYCAKLLHLDRGAEGSMHYHPVKQETFYCLEGQVALTIEDTDYMLGQFSRPKTIMPGQKHQIKGICDSVILEVSTHHDEKDVVRLSQSKPAPEEGWYNNASRN